MINTFKLQQLADSLGVSLQQHPQSDSKLDPEKKPQPVFNGKFYRYWVKSLIETDMATGQSVVKYSVVLPAKDSDFKREYKPRRGKGHPKPKKIILDQATDTQEEIL